MAPCNRNPGISVMLCSLRPPKLTPKINWNYERQREREEVWGYNHKREREGSNTAEREGEGLWGVQPQQTGRGSMRSTTTTHNRERGG